MDNLEQKRPRGRPPGRKRLPVTVTLRAEVLNEMKAEALVNGWALSREIEVRLEVYKRLMRSGIRVIDAP